MAWIVVALLWSGMAGTALAADCGPPPGKIVMDDAFSDRLNGWGDDPAASFGKPHLALTLAGEDTSWNFTTSSFDAADADYCLQFTLPASLGGDNLTDAGLLFDVADAENKFQALAYSNGSVLLERESGGKYTTLFETDRTDPPLTPGTPVALHVPVQGGLITLSVNGTRLKQVRAKMSGAPAAFGVFAERAKAAKADTTITFDHLRVSELP